MVAQASDSLGVEQGLAANAIADMPLSVFDEMPMDVDDAALSELDEAVEAATETPDRPFDVDSLTDAQREYLRSHLTAAEVAKFEQDRRNLQQTFSKRETALSRERDQLREQAEITAMSLAAAIEHVRKIDPDEAERLSAKLITQQAQTQQQRQVATQAFQSFAQGEVQAHLDHLQKVSVDEQGRQLFDPMDGEIAGQFKKYIDAAQKHMRSGAGADSPLALAAQREFDRISTLVERKRLDGERRLLAPTQQAKKVQTAQEQQRVRQVQQQRGRQAVVRGTAGGGYATPMDALRAVKAEMPDATLEQQSMVATRRFREQQAQQQPAQVRR